MAYLDLDNLFAAPVASSGERMPGDARTDSGFSALEWSVIALAQRDTLRSLASPGRMSRAIGSLFGLGATSRLADPRLEALRRMAVHAWRRGFAVPIAEIDHFLSHGFTETQMEALVVSVTGLRIGQTARR